MRIKYYIVDKENKFIRGYFTFHSKCQEIYEELKKDYPEKIFKICWIYA